MALGIAAAAIMAAGSIGSAAIQSGAGPGPGQLPFNDRSPVNIAPKGVNLGEIMQPFNQSSPANGGYGVETPSRYTGKIGEYTEGFEANKKAGNVGISWPFILLLAGGSVFLIGALK